MSSSCIHIHCLPPNSKLQKQYLFYYYNYYHHPLHFLRSSIFTMNSSDFSAGKSPRRELQGPRPTPLKVRKDSHKIKKPPPVPQPSQQQAPPRPPVIIYTVSPKIIHTNPSDFMTLVQRLTGSSSSSSSSSEALSKPLSDNSGAISPAARYASIEKTRSSPEGRKNQGGREVGFMDDGVERIRSSGILSPAPASLAPIPANFFSPLSDSNYLSYFHDLSPVLHGNRNFMEGSFMPSPSSFLSPTPSMDLFNNFPDFN